MPAILVPFDGSESALRAAQYAIVQAKRARCGVHVLNVQPPLDDYAMVPAYLSKRRHRGLATERARDTVTPVVKRLRQARTRHTVHVIISEVVAETIARTARRLKCESIIMGTRGMTALGNVVLGSVASRVIHLATIPVTLVKQVRSRQT